MFIPVLSDSVVKRKFKPTDLAGCILWLDANQITGLGDGDAVTTWLDASSQANNVTEAVNKPVYKVNIINSLPVVRFDATNDTLATTGAVNLTGTNQLTLFWVGTTPTGDTRMIFGSGNVNSYIDSFEAYKDASDGFFTFMKGDAGYSSASRGSVPTNATVMCFLFDKSVATNEAKIWINNLAGTTNSNNNNTNNFGNRQWWLNARDGTSLFAGMDCAELILYNSALSDANRQIVQNYLAAKYNITF